jgi:hypothetical protein
MGALTQSFLDSAARPNRRGIALPSGILAIVAVGVLVGGLFAMTDLGAKAVSNREASSRALHVAEAGAAHALGLMRVQFKSTKATRLLQGADNAPNTADDGVIDGYATLTTLTSIPIAGRQYGGGRYFVTIKDDPADPTLDLKTDGNYRLLLECKGVMDDGSSADLRVIVSHIQLPGVALDGDLEVSGKLDILGACGGAHVNGKFTGGGEPSAAVEWSSTEGTIPDKFVGIKTPGAPPMPIPDLNPMSYCPVGAKTSLGALASLNGVYCIDGNVNLSGDVGSLTNWKNVTIIASGSIKISGKPFFRSAHPEGFVLLAGGDLDIQGDGGFDGIAYCGGQTYISSKPTFRGQLVCKDKSPHPGSDIVDKNQISGDAEVTFDCTNTLNRAYRIVAWYPEQGT